MADLWEKVKKTATELYTTASEKAVEGVSIGVKKLDEANLRRELSREFAALGGRIYQLLQRESPGDLTEDPAVRHHLSRLKELEERLEAKEREIQALQGDEDDVETGAEPVGDAAEDHAGDADPAQASPGEARADQSPGADRMTASVEGGTAGEGRRDPHE